VKALSLTVQLHYIILEKSDSGTQEWELTTESTDMPTLVQAIAFLEYRCKALQLIYNMYTSLQNLLSIPKVVNKPMMSHIYSGTVPMLQGYTSFSQV
jgi:hypothetical protein